MPNLKRWLLLGISLLSLTNCAPNPPDVPAFKWLKQRLATDPLTQHIIIKPDPHCMEQIKEPECGYGVFVKTGKEIFVGELPANLYKGKTWSQLREQSIYLPVKESYEPLEAYVIDSCKKMGCEDDVTRFKIKIDRLAAP